MANYYPATPYPMPFFDPDTGELLAGGSLEAYRAQSSTPVDMYSDKDGTSAGDTITLNVGGYPQVSGDVIVIHLAASVEYKFILKDSAGNQIWSADDISNLFRQVPFSQVFATVAATKADASVVAGQTVRNLEHTSGYGYKGGNTLLARAVTGGTDDNGSLIKSTGNTDIEFVALFQDGPNVAQFGGDSTGTNDARTALANADAYGDFEITAGTYKVSSNITLSSKVTFAPGAKLSIDSGVTVTFSQNPSAPIDQQIFSGSGAVEGLTSCSVGWWGAAADGSTDDSTAFNNSVAAIGSEGGEIILLAGDHSVSSTCLIARNDITVKGFGPQVSRLVGSGATSPVLQIGGASHNPYRIHCRDFGIARNLGGASKSGTVGLHYVRSAHADHCSFETMVFNGSSRNVRVGDGTYRPEAFTLWRDCEFGNYDQADTYAFEVYDGIEQKFIGCRFQGFDSAGFFVLSGYNPNDWVFTSCYFGSTSYAFGGTGGDYAVQILDGFGYFFSNCVFEQGKEANVFIGQGKIFHFSNCLCGGAGYTGFGYRIQGSSGTISGVTISGGEIRDFGQANSNHSGTGRAVFVESSTSGVKRVAITGLSIRNDTTERAIRTDSDYVSVTGCSIFCAADGGSAVLLTSGASHCAITGNTIDCSANTGATNAIQLNSGADDNILIGNAINPGSGTAISDAGTGNTTTPNII